MGERTMRYAIELKESEVRVLRAAYGSIQRAIEKAVRELIESKPEMRQLEDILKKVNA